MGVKTVMISVAPVFRVMGVAVFFLFSSVAHAKLPWLGQFLYQYEGGTVYRVSVPNDTQMHWQCIQGSESGAAGDEKPQRIAVNDNIYFVTWTERSGAQVTQVLDFSQMHVYSTVVIGKEKFILRGTIRREH